MKVTKDRAKLPAKKAIAVMLLLGCSSAQADLLEYQYQDTTGNDKNSNSSDKYINPKGGNITFALSGGIDRKVNVTLYNAADKPVETVTSKLLGATDRITVSGKEHYGALLKLKTPSADGSYTVKTETLSSDGKVVKSNTHPIIIDKQAPTISGSPAYKNRSSWTAADLHVFGGGGLSSLSVTGVSDNETIDKAFFVSKLDGSDKEILTPVTVDNGKIEITSDTRPSWFESPKGNYTVGFRVVDGAGNAAEKLWQAFIDTTNASEYVNQWEIVGVRVPGESVWQPYTQGMKAPSNPAQIAWGFRNDIISGVNGTLDGINPRAGSRSLTAQSELPGYMVYIDSLRDYNGSSYTSVAKHAGSRLSITANQVASKLDFSDFDKAPRPTGLQYKLAGDNTWRNGFSAWLITNKPVTVSAIKGSVQARGYKQRFSVSGVGACDIEAGSTVCEASANLTLGTTNGRYVPHSIVVADAVGKLGSTPQGYLYTRWDTKPLVLSDFKKVGNEITGRITDTEGCITDNCYWSPDTSWVSLVDPDTNERLKYSQNSLVRVGAKDWVTRFDTTKYKEGNWDIYIGAKDKFGNVTEELFQSATFLDRTPPVLEISRPEGNSISSLDEILLLLSDNSDPNPKVTSVRMMGGPTSDNIQLPWRKESEGVFRLEYPLLFPSLKEGETYELNVTAEDEQGNKATKSTFFEYMPPFVRLKNGMDGKLLIPNIQRAVQRSDGSNIVETEPFTLSDGSLVHGSYDVYATLRADAQFPMVINGVTIQPGETSAVLNQHNFANSEGRLSIPMYAANDTVGEAEVMISTAAPNSPILLLSVKTWEAKAQLSAEAWTVRQVVDNLHILASPTAGTPCRFTSNRQQAMAADPLKDPTCYIEWVSIPDESEEQMITVDGLRVAGIVGQAMSLGEQPIEYRLSIFSNGEKIYLGEGEKMLTVEPAYGSIGVEPPASSLKSYRNIGEVNIPFKQTMGPDCSLTLDAAVALREAQNRAFTSKARTCLFEYTKIPDGLVQSLRDNAPKLNGYQEINGSVDIEWRISMYSRSGSRISLNNQETKLVVGDPEAPSIDVDSKYHFRDNVYVVPKQENNTWLGEVSIQGVAANVDMSIYHDDKQLERETYSSGYNGLTNINRRLEAEPRSLWNTQVFSFAANYSDLPELKTEQDINVITAPATNITPIVSSPTDVAVNSSTLPVRVTMLDYANQKSSYHSDYGVWETRVLLEERYGSSRPLSDWVVTNNQGVADFSVSLSDVDTASVRLLAEARLISDLDGYERTEMSRRPLTMQLLRGNSIESSVIGRRMSGPAPFSAVFKLDLEERLDLRALDDVEWYVANGDGDWELQAANGRSNLVFVNLFEEGVYRVKAKTINANSGAESFTEVVEVTAYPMADFSIKGPSALFPGDTGHYSMSGKLGDVAITAENSDIEWSVDGGKTFSIVGPTASLTQTGTGVVRLMARVRSKTAPEDNVRAWERVTQSVSFAKILPPKVKISGPSRVESGVEYTYNVDVSNPYRGMEYPLSGHWELPDGTEVTGDSIKYTPTERDVLRGSVNLRYVAWIEQYREQGAEAEAQRISKVWQYNWPRFVISARKTAGVAPAQVAMTVRPIAHRGSLEEPVYKWILPEGIEVTEERQPTVRKVNIGAAGSYPIKVEITDARGNKSTATETVVLGVADPYVVKLEPRLSNEYSRAPLSVYVRPRVSGGHPRDRIDNYRYFINGKEEMLDSKSSSARLTLPEGTHTVELKAETAMGYEALGSEQIVVTPNKIPVCSLDSRERSNGWSVSADCKDEDGRVRSFEWTLGDGSPVATGSRRMGLTKWNYPEGVTVSVVAIDDAEGRSLPVSVNLSDSDNKEIGTATEQ